MMGNIQDGMMDLLNALQVAPLALLRAVAGDGWQGSGGAGEKGQSKGN
jgi:hypothetical protein